jgi:toxin ParE1/3/4
MAYVVRIAARAERDLASLYRHIHASESIAAEHWYAGMKRAILSLAVRPNRCPITPENKRLRHLLYGRKPHVYRVIYRVDGRQQRVDILHIRHGARRPFRRAELG